MKNKGIKKQLENDFIYDKSKGITLKQIKELTEYVFKSNNLQNEKEIKSYPLKIVQNNEYHYYKINGITTGFLGFKNLMEHSLIKEFIKPIYFNDVELSEEAINQFWEQFEKFSAKNK